MNSRDDVVLAYNPLTSPTSGYAIIDASAPGAPVLVKKTFTVPWTSQPGPMGIDRR